jgi:outer membrane protein TolC
MAGGTLAKSSSVEHPQNAFLTDPYNATTGVLGIALHWQPDLFTRLPKVEQAEAARAKAKAQLQMAMVGLPAEAERALAEARDARDRMAAAREGVKHSKAWLASVMQSEAAGLSEPKDLADSLLQYFMQRGRLTQATYEWNVGVVALMRATGRPPTALRYEEED